MDRQGASFEPLGFEPTYEEALKECAAGRSSAIAGIYLAEGRRLRAAAQRIVRNRARAEDVIHDSFIQILRDASGFDPARGSARTWIYAIVRNTALKNLRRAGREIAMDADTLNTIRTEPQILAESSARMAEDTDLRTCLEHLEPRRRASLVLAIVDGRTHVEIAEHLGVPVGTVKAWIRRELVALRERLK